MGPGGRRAPPPDFGSDYPTERDDFRGPPQRDEPGFRGHNEEFRGRGKPPPPGESGDDKRLWGFRGRGGPDFNVERRMMEDRLRQNEWDPPGNR